jgi:hypothetical protein
MSQLIGDPVTNLAATSLIRAALADDADSGILVMSQHGGAVQGADEATVFMMSLAAVGARAILSASGYNVARALQMLDAWSAEYAQEPAS